MRVSNPHKSLPWLAAALSLGACSREPGHEPLAAPEPTILGTVERQCGECHIGSNPGSLPEALAWFDLEDPEWLAGLPRQNFDAAFMARILPWIEMATAEEVHAAIATDLARRGGGE